MLTTTDRQQIIAEFQRGETTPAHQRCKWLC